MSCAGAAGVTGGFEASGGSPDPLRPKRPAGLGGTAQLSKWRLGKQNLDLIGLSDTVECIKTGEAVKGIGALWESAAVQPLPRVCVWFSLTARQDKVALKDPHQGGLTSATPSNNNLRSRCVNEGSLFYITVSNKLNLSSR